MPSEAPARKSFARSTRPALAALAAGLAILVGTAAAASGGAAGPKVIQLPIRTDGPKSMDPARGSTQYDNQACSNVYETLLQFKYLVRPLELEPLLLAAMPEHTDNPDGTRTWRFRLRPGTMFQDDPCFPGGKGRELVSDDVFYSWKRLADPANNLANWPLFDGMVVGFNEYKAAQEQGAKAGQAFNYDAPVAGFHKVSDHEFEVVLTKPVYKFLYVLAQFQTSVVPREAVEKYGATFAVHPVGTGPFTLAEGDWKPGEKMILNKSPTYHEDLYPSELPKDPALAAVDKALGLDKAAGQRLPLVDRIEVTFYVPDAPMWLDFQSGKLAFAQVPAEYFEKAYIKRSKRLRKEYADRGVVSFAVPMFDMIFRGFNMEDPIVGGYTVERKKLRQALNLAFDLDFMNDSFYNGLNVQFDGPIPRGMDGFPPDGRAPVSYRGPDLDRARKLLAEAGYPNGKNSAGNQLVLEYYTSRGGNLPEQTQAEQRFLDQIGVKLNAHFLDFSELDEAVKIQKKAQMFGYAWGSDYPDAENNLALFYSKYKSPGNNSFNYENPEYDRLYEQIRVMEPGSGRTAIYEKMRDIIIEDCPIIGSSARTRYWLVNPWVKNCKPTEDFLNWMKYLDVDDAKRE